MKAKIADQISDVIAQKQLTQIEVAELLDVEQPKVSALVRGKLSVFSVERLFRFLNTLKNTVEIRIIPNLQPDGQAQTRVVSA